MSSSKKKKPSPVKGQTSIMSFFSQPASVLGAAAGGGRGAPASPLRVAQDSKAPSSPEIVMGDAESSEDEEGGGAVGMSEVQTDSQIDRMCDGGDGAAGGGGEFPNTDSQLDRYEAELDGGGVAAAGAAGAVGAAGEAEEDEGNEMETDVVVVVEDTAEDMQEEEEEEEEEDEEQQQEEQQQEQQPALDDEPVAGKRQGHNDRRACMMVLL